ncbi:hypothetical protein [Robertmurraya sp.]|uniref:hypothetical protein n=1 Tax=Robertmurraya sp. TaxID=2837525 RepID=UPI003704520A
MGHYQWEVPKLYTDASDWQNISTLMTALPAHIANAIHVQVNLSGDYQLDVLSVYWCEETGTLHVDVAK